MKQPVKIILDEPITIGNAQVSELTARPLKVRDRLAVEAAHKEDTDLEKEVHLMALMVGIAGEELYDMGLGDYAKITAAFKSFLPGEAPKKSET